jgi:hypothetical protein
MTDFVHTKNADFATFFMRYYVLPFDTWASLSHDQFDYVMRFETLADDFEHVLRQLGLQPERPLPFVNQTADRRREFEAYYPPRTRSRARRVFGPYMARWGYTFPLEWGIAGPTVLDRVAYRMFSFYAQLYWRLVRPRI